MAEDPIERYHPAECEPKWQRAWEEAKLFEAEDPAASDRPPYYVLEMFPYPSGRIHIGHTRNYTMGDVVARHRRARGYNVLHPMGWDAFGLPAENAAMKSGRSAAEWTYANIATMRDQLKLMGLAIDWSREFATCDVDYYAQQQALFLDFLEAGFAYRKAARVNWDPEDQTVLANEQVIDGRGWRSGALVEQRELTQWFFAISDMAEELLDALDGLDDWPDKVRTMQRNWIGRSRGLGFALEVQGAPEGFESLPVYTTRPGHHARRELRRHRGDPPARQGAGPARRAGGRVQRRLHAPRHLGGRDREGGEVGLRHGPQGRAALRSR